MFVVSDKNAWSAWRYVLFGVGIAAVLSGPVWIVALLTMHVTVKPKSKRVDGQFQNEHA